MSCEHIWGFRKSRESYCVTCGIAGHENVFQVTHAEVVKLRADLARVSAKLEAARAWRESVLAEVTKWAVRDFPPSAIIPSQPIGESMYVRLDAYQDVARMAHLAAGAVEALKAELRAARGTIEEQTVRANKAEQALRDGFGCNGCPMISGVCPCCGNCEAP